MKFAFTVISVYFFSGLKLLALPAEVERMIQADQYVEALARVETALKEKPDDLELIRARKELLLIAGTVSAGSNPTVSSPSRLPDKPVPLSPLAAKELELIMADVNQKSGDARKAPVKELFSRTESLLKTHPENLNLWAMHGLAALELADAAAAKNAGTNLLRLGADRSSKPQTLTLMAMLSRKGWLLTEQELAQVRAAELAETERKKAEAAKLAADNEAKIVAQRAAARKEAERKAAAYRASPEGIAERLRNNLR